MEKCKAESNTLHNFCPLCSWMLGLHGAQDGRCPTPDDSLAEEWKDKGWCKPDRIESEPLTLEESSKLLAAFVIQRLSKKRVMSMTELMALRTAKKVLGVPDKS